MTRNSPPVDSSDLPPPFAPRNEAEAWLFSLERLGIRPGLTTIRRLLLALGNPEARYPSVVIAGTNGKGSVTTFLDQLARHAGLKTGLYTSPHLLRLNERIRVGGRPIEDSELERRVRRHRPLFELEEATFFESLTALAFEYFADSGIDVAFLEVGLGGRLDATNAAAKVAVVLTSVAMDHRALLGPGLEDIAREKLSLCEPGLPVYLGRLSANLHRFAVQEIAARGAELAMPAQLPAASWRTDSLGEIQRRQAALSAAVYDDLAGRRGWPRHDAEAGVELRVPARYQLAGSAPRLIVDPAHNAEAVEALLRQWRAETAREASVFVFGQMEDKELDSLYPDIHAAAAEIVVAAPSWPRALPVDRLQERLAIAGDSRIHASRSVADALLRARALAGAAGSVLLFGSNFLVAEALDRLGFDDLDAVGASSLWDGGGALRNGPGGEDSP